MGEQMSNDGGSSRRRLKTMTYHVLAARHRPAAAAAAGAGRSAGSSSQNEITDMRRQTPGQKRPDEHASNQGASMRTVTAEQLFLMDTRGYIVLPAVLPPAQCDEIKAHLYAGGSPFEGPAQELLDHPVLVDVLNEFLVERDLHNDYYNFRCENSFATIRSAGFKAGGTDLAHTVRPPQRANAMRYHAAGGRIFTGLTRCVWELNEVKATDGGTRFLAGSHKAHFETPAAMIAANNEHMDAYACPPGSCIVFTESLYHAAVNWDNPQTDRVAIFNCCEFSPRVCLSLPVRVCLHAVCA
jgi:hypothetical protein